ncbi:neprilysin-11-like [Musca autumnalis]|uniref:neprilysin-11-like n=1 Tax=Musca autumnalis TaxID=221902 RepID=UPI003CF5A4F2
MSADPCLELNQYSCGNWRNDQPEGHYKFYSVEEKLNYEVDKEFVDYFSNERALRNKPKFVRKANDFYKSCEANPEFNAMFYVKWLKKYEKIKWALLVPQYADDGVDAVAVDANDADYDWLYVLAVARKYGMNDIFIQQTLINKGQSSPQLMLHLSRNTEQYGLQRINEYYATPINNTLDIPAGSKDFMDYFNEAMDFEYLLKEVEIKENQENQVLKVKDLPYPWLKRYLKVILDNQLLNEEMEVAITNMSYFEALNKLIKEYKSDFLSRYVEIRFLVYLYRPRYWSCIQLTRSLMPMAMHWIYVDLHPIPELEFQEIQEMFDKIEQNINQTLHEDDRKVVPKESFSKLNSLKLKIGNLPRQDTVKTLEAYYSSLKLNPYHFFSNHLQLLKLYFDFNQRTTLDNEWRANPQKFFDISEKFRDLKELNSHYLPTINVLLLPSYFLRPPIYHPYFEDIYKYSSLGYVLGSGIYRTLEIPDIIENEQNLLVDIGGVAASFRTFFSAATNAPQISLKEEFLKLLTPQQLFIINSMQRQCSIFSSSPGSVYKWTKFLPEVSSAFNCKFYSFMQEYSLMKDYK